MRIGAALLFGVALSSCMSTDLAPMEDQFCAALTTWIETIPKADGDQRFIAFFRGGCREDALCMYSLAWQTECESCGDAADQNFATAVAPMTHYVSVDELAEYSGRCLSAPDTIRIDVSNEQAAPQVIVVNYNDQQVVIEWERADCGFYGCTTIAVISDRDAKL